MTRDHDDALVRFIRDTLGCECPDEVLRTIRCRSEVELPPSSVGATRIDVGGRLLVYVVRVDSASGRIQSLLNAAIGAGIEERDSGGFNRFRLVLATNAVAEVDAVARSAFAACHCPDGRVHLHVVELADVPGTLRPRASQL